MSSTKLTLVHGYVHNGLMILNVCINYVCISNSFFKVAIFLDISTSYIALKTCPETKQWLKVNEGVPISDCYKSNCSHMGEHV